MFQTVLLTVNLPKNKYNQLLFVSDCFERLRGQGEKF